jgi:hypothetical protein
LAQNKPSGLEYDAISAASVPALAALKLSDQKASFQLSTRHNKPVDASVPIASGRMTCVNSSHSVAPSMRAASRMSGGMSFSPEYSIQTMIGRFDSVKTMTSAVSESSRPVVCAIT